MWKCGYRHNLKSVLLIIVCVWEGCRCQTERPAPSVEGEKSSQWFYSACEIHWISWGKGSSIWCHVFDQPRMTQPLSSAPALPWRLLHKVRVRENWLGFRGLPLPQPRTGNPSLLWSESQLASPPPHHVCGAMVVVIYPPLPF